MPTEPEQFAWLIESVDSNGPTFWTGKERDQHSFSSDINEAVRFSRRQDADRIITRILNDAIRFMVRAVEHGWSRE